MADAKSGCMGSLCYAGIILVQWEEKEICE